MVATKNLYQVNFDDCTAAIIAGGKAKRMGGVPKGLIQVSGEPILAHLKKMLASLFPRTIMICNDPAPYQSFGLEIFPDVIADRGAPGGVHAALAHASSDWIFAVGCDMPHIYPLAVQWIASHRAHFWDAVVVTHKARIESLHAFYRTTCFPAFDAAVRAGEPSFRDILKDLRTKTLHEKELLAAHMPLRTFWNINTPADLERVSEK
ncbi:MAG: molybdenum cofactor guanylyltransferase [Deltaproteobacteria bacterium]|nr:molybdenum cofactor guanylyltransferase [Deltaproteobacteria bacterium]